MALVFQRRLATPVWAIAFFTLTLTTPPTTTLSLMPPTTLFAITAVGIAMIVFWMPGSITWLRASRALAFSHPDTRSGDHDRVGTRGAEGSHDVALYGDVPTERLGGRS